MPPTVLVTANVFQNGLSRYDQSSQYYTSLLCRLPTLNVNWYITELDHILAFTLWDYFQMGGDRACQDAYLQMRRILKICRVDQCILEDSGFANLNFFDAIRLSCGIDLNVDVIVTWEPGHFASTDRDRRSANMNGYFDRTFRSILADDGSLVSHKIRVSNVSAFLLHLNDLDYSFSYDESLGSFQLKQLDFNSNEEGNTATVEVFTPAGERIQGVVNGSSPCEAICAAIDQCIDRCIILPRRSLVHLNVPDMIGGASSPVDVMISVTCDQRLFQASANHTNVLRAFGNAYINVINQIYSVLDFNRFS
jgi:hypothetical protein